MFSLAGAAPAHEVVLRSACVRRRRLLLAAAWRAARRRGRRQAREPPADRRVQGARRPDLCRRAHAPRAGGARASSRRRAAITARASPSPGGAFGLAVTIVVPHGNSREKNAAMRALGAELIEHGQDFQAAREEAMRLAETRGLHAVPSFHRDLVLGVATYALELLSDHPDLDALYVPIGQGSGICGCIAARDALGLKTEIVGVQSSAGAGLRALLRRRPCRSHQQRRHVRRRHGDARSRRGGARRHRQGRGAHRRWSATTRSRRRSAPIGPIRTISPRARARRRSRRR